MNLCLMLLCLLQFKMANQEGVNWVSVLGFLQKQQTQSTLREKQWNLEKHNLQQKINRLQAELDANRIIINDLLNRIKLLQIALFESKTEKGKINKQNGLKQEDLANVQNLLEKYKVDSKAKGDNHKEFLTQILNQIGVDSTEVFPPTTNAFLDEENSLYLKKQANLKIKQTGSITAHLDAIRKIYVNDNKDFVVTVSEDCLVKVWSYSNLIKNKHDYLEPVKTFRQHAGPLFALTGGPSPFNPQQSLFFTGGSDSLIKSWKIHNKGYSESAFPTNTWNGSKKSDMNITIWDLAFKSNKLLSSTSEGIVDLYEFHQTEGGILKAQFKEKQFNPTCVTWMTDDTFIQGCSNAPRSVIWDINGKVRQKYLYETPKGSQAQQHQTNQISYHKSLKIIALGCEDGAIRLYSSNINKIIRKLPLNSSVSCLKQVREWQLACGTHSGSLSIWDLRNYQKIKQFDKAHLTKYDEGVLCLWTEPGKILSGGADGIIKIFS